MRVKLCARCPYTPRDLDDHYDPAAANHACARCDGQQDRGTLYYPRETYRRRKCSIVPSIFSIPQRSAAPSVAASSVSSGTIPGDRSSVRRSVPIGSRSGEKATAIGFTRFEPPGSDSGSLEENCSSSGSRHKELAQ
jgi:hypothetical protein